MSISMDALGSLYTSDSSYTDNSTKSLEDTLKSDLTGATDDQLMDVCKEFESYFTELVFKEMEKSIPDNDQGADSASKQMKDYYKEQLIGEWSKMSAESSSGMGLADQLYKQIKRNYNME